MPAIDGQLRPRDSVLGPRSRAARAQWAREHGAARGERCCLRASGCAKKCARKSARIAHELPSDELMRCTPGTKSLEMHTICRERERAREDSNL